MIHRIGDKVPLLGADAFVAWNAEVAGDVELGSESSVWFSASLRGDIAPIRLGERTNVQDNAVIHVDPDMPCLVGSDVTVGHGAILHSCVIGDACLIGMGAIVLSGAEIGPGSVVGAGALVTQGKRFPAGSLLIGNPARALSTVSAEDQAKIIENAAHYVRSGRQARSDYSEA
jgi:carbonic anhydrase/acetyltransferase-like protein (isoleucine patch superfamily)